MGELTVKQRLIVMNGQCIVQSEEGGRWKDNKVGKAGAIKPGVYNIYLAAQADKEKTHDGMILYADGDSLYQQIDKKYVKHALSDFDKVPEVGVTKAIKYEQGRAVVSAASVKLVKGRSL